jgi:anti-sigma B factor antagonist
MELVVDVQPVAEHGAVLSIRGRLDAVAAPALAARFQALIAGARVELVCDLSEVDFLDSSALAALVSGLKAAREHGGSLKVVGMNEEVARTFRATTLDRVFELYPSVEAALG